MVVYILVADSKEPSTISAFATLKIAKEAAREVEAARGCLTTIYELNTADTCNRCKGVGVRVDRRSRCCKECHPLYAKEFPPQRRREFLDGFEPATYIGG